MSPSKLFPLAILFLAAACSDAVTSPAKNGDSNPGLAVQSGGNPKFSNKETDCTTSGTTITCTYKITGLGNTDIVDVFLVAGVQVSGQCRNNGGQIVPAKDFQSTVTGSALAQRPQNGQINGSLTVDATSASTPNATAVCPNGNWTLANLSFTFTSAPDLFANVYRQDGSSIRIDSQF
jgi:hypothetical protein